MGTFSGPPKAKEAVSEGAPVAPASAAAAAASAKARKAAAANTSNAPVTGTVLFVKNLAFATTEETVRATFEVRCGCKCNGGMLPSCAEMAAFGGGTERRTSLGGWAGVQYLHCPEAEPKGTQGTGTLAALKRFPQAACTG